MRLSLISPIQLQTRFCHLRLKKRFPTSNCFVPCLQLKAVIGKHSITHILGYCGHGTQHHGCQEPCRWRRPRAEQVNDNKMDWPDKRWMAKQCKLTTQFPTACLVSPVARMFRSGIHFLKFSAFLTFWKILPESLGSLQTLGGVSGCCSGGQVPALPPGGRNRSSNKTDFTGRAGGELGGWTKKMEMC